jgi:hypothetical protein
VNEASERVAEQAQADLDRLVRRLRRFSPRAWSTAGREERVRALAAALAVIGGEGHELPRVATHALPDVVAVVGYDALQTEGAVPAVRALLLAALDALR